MTAKLWLNAVSVTAVRLHQEFVGGYDRVTGIYTVSYDYQGLKIMWDARIIFRCSQEKREQ